MNQIAQPPLVPGRSNDYDAVSRNGDGFAGLLWLTWRQHRWALIGSVVLTAVLTGWMVYLAADLKTIYHQCHNTVCASGTSQDSVLSASFGPFSISNHLLQFIVFLPLMVGVFLGVPLLAREHEQRTLLLAWCQDISPAQWLWTKLTLLGISVAALTAILSAACDHLAHAMSNVSGGGMFAGAMFLDSGMLPLALSVCWFAVGVTLGAAIRRILPSAIAAVAGFMALLVIVEWRYPTLITPLSRFRPVGNDSGPVLGINALKIKGGLSIGPGQVSNLFDASGHAVSYADLQKSCPDLSPGTLISCMTHNHLETFIQYQPGNRIPEFHLILASGYLSIGAIALLAAGLIVRHTSLNAG
ncbi:MAG TPA: hypothetical protein VIJ31_03245 [Acidothermaceae bacterium]